MSTKPLATSTSDLAQLDRQPSSALKETTSSLIPTSTNSSVSLANFHPLCFSKDVFNAPKFSEDEFILECRQRVPLESVLADLKKFSSILEVELVELINKDYADFVNLSSNLTGIDKVVNDLRSSILAVRKDLQSVRNSVDGVIVEMESKLEEKRAVGRKKAILQLFAEAHATLGKIEKLLQLDSESQQQQQTSSSSASPTQQTLRAVLFNGTISSSTDTSASTDGSPDASGLIERVATDFNQLKYYVSRGKGLPFMERVEKRMSAIEQLLVEGLEQVFKQALSDAASAMSSAAVAPGSPANPSVSGNTTAATRSTDMISNCLRTYAAIERVQEAEKVFRTQICLPRLQSIITEDRLEGGTGRGGVVLEALSRVYADVLSFVERDCSLLLSAARGSSSSAPFAFIACGVFPAVTELLSARGGQRLFAAGLPDAFHKHYSATLLFIDLLERHASSAEELQRLRTSQSYTDFMRRFNTAVYFRLRFQEIAKKLDSALVSVCVVKQPAGSVWLLNETAETAEAIRKCWDSSILLSPIADNFLRLTLQIVARYRQWVQSGLDRLASANTPATPGVPVTTPESAAWSVLPPEQHLFVVRDLEKLAATLRSDLPSEIAAALPNYSREIISLAKELLNESASSLDQMVLQLGQAIVVATQLRKCAEKLEPFRLLPATYRMTNKPTPTRPSHFIAQTALPLRAFLAEEATKQMISQSARSAWVQDVLAKLSELFHEMTKELLTNLLKGFKRKQGSASDVEKTVAQVILDVDAFGTSVIQEFGVDANSFEAYQRLKSTATTMVAEIRKELSSAQSAPVVVAAGTATTAI